MSKLNSKEAKGTQETKALANGPIKEIATTKTVVKDTPKAKTVAELVEEQKAYFAKKNDILKKLHVFERKYIELDSALTQIDEEEKGGGNVFSDFSGFSLVIKKGHSSEICSIKTDVIVKRVIIAVLGEIERNQRSLEEELLSN